MVTALQIYGLLLTLFAVYLVADRYTKMKVWDKQYLTRTKRGYVYKNHNLFTRIRSMISNN